MNKIEISSVRNGDALSRALKDVRREKDRLTLRDMCKVVHYARLRTSERIKAIGGGMPGATGQ